MLLVLAIAVRRLLRVATAHWREGSVLLGGALLVAAALRAALPRTARGCSQSAAGSSTSSPTRPWASRWCCSR